MIKFYPTSLVINENEFPVKPFLYGVLSHKQIGQTKTSVVCIALFAFCVSVCPNKCLDLFFVIKCLPLTSSNQMMK